MDRELDLALPAVGVPIAKVQWIESWDPWTLLGPLYAWGDESGQNSSPVLLLLLSWFADKVVARRLRMVRPLRVYVGDFCRTDAKAEGDKI
eukprot:4914115-Amphidinium_carterae.1